MNEVRNVNRYWVDKYSQVIVRKWTDEENKLINPHTHIFEKYWSYYCHFCGIIPIPVLTKEDAKKNLDSHISHFVYKQRHKGFIKYRDHELICLEYKEEFIEDFGMWVTKQEFYN